jgi:hypothetical protein
VPHMLLMRKVAWLEAQRFLPVAAESGTFA